MENKIASWPFWKYFPQTYSYGVWRAGVKQKNALLTLRAKAFVEASQDAARTEKRKKIDAKLALKQDRADHFGHFEP